MNALLLAMKVARYAPRSVLRGAAWTGATVAWLRNGKSARRLEHNLARVTGLEGRELRRVTRAGMVSAGRYYAEVLELPRLTGEQIDARVRWEGGEEIIESLRAGGAAVIALSHSGNWDTVGAHTTRNLAPVTTVAEKLEPPEVFEAFVRLREDRGMTIFGLEGSSTFRRLITAAKTTGGTLCLLADRDLSGTGTEVEMWGHGVRVAPGPAALAAATGLPLVPLLVYYERLHGAQRRQARSRWGVVMSFGPAIDPASAPADDRVVHLTRLWTAWMADAIARHPQDWHMLQRFGWVS